MKAFTLTDLSKPWVDVKQFTLHDRTTKIDAIVVGESGRGRSLGVVPVKNLPLIPCPQRGKGDNGIYFSKDETRACNVCGTPLEMVSKGMSKFHPVGGVIKNPQWCSDVVGGRCSSSGFVMWTSDDACRCCGTVYVSRETFTGVHPQAGLVKETKMAYCHLGETKSGRPAVIFDDRDDGDDRCLVVVTPGIGYRGGNRIDMPEGANILATGQIAQGDAGCMGHGDEIIAVIPKGGRITCTRSGRLYGNPAVIIFDWDGINMSSSIPEEAGLLD